MRRSTWRIKGRGVITTFWLPGVLLSGVACRSDQIAGSADPSAVAELAVASNSWSARAAMPRGRVGLAAAVVNNPEHQPILYAIGGDDGRLVTLATVEAYDFATDSWSTKAPLPTPLESTNGAAVIDGKIYVSGGRDLDNHSPGSDDGFPRKSLFVYSPASNTWTRKADMPLPSMEGQTGVINGQLYVLLGDITGFYRYDPPSDTWSALAPPPIDHTLGSAAAINGKFYVAGGVRFSVNGRYATRKLHVYDPVTNTWIAKAPLPRGTEGAAGARLLGRFYVLGGDAVSVSRRLVQAYDPVADTWTLKAPLPTPRYGLAAANVVLSGQQHIVAIGGYGGLDSRWLRSNDIYTP